MGLARTVSLNPACSGGNISSFMSICLQLVSMICCMVILYILYRDPVKSYVDPVMMYGDPVHAVS